MMFELMVFGAHDVSWLSMNYLIYACRNAGISPNASSAGMCSIEVAVKV
jgi:hypothetical protein